MSSGVAEALPPAPSIAATVCSSGSARRPQIATVAPSRASSSADARPSPVPPPGDGADLPLEQAGREDAGAVLHRRGRLSVATLARDEGPCGSTPPRRADARGQRGRQRRRGADQGGRDPAAAGHLRAHRRPPREGSHARDRHAALALALGAVPGLSHPSSDGGPGSRGHGPASLGGGEADGEPGPHHHQVRPPSPRPRRGPSRSAARPRGRLARGAARGHDPPPRGSCIGNVGVRRRDVRALGGGVAGSDHRGATAPAGLPAPALRLRVRLPHRRASATASSPTPPSAAPSTSSATAASASPTRRATRRGTSR